MTIVHRTINYALRAVNRVITFALPWLPRWMVQPFASPYVAGETVDDAIRHIRALNQQGYSTTLDILGEHVQSREEAQVVTDAYCNLFDRIHTENLDSTVSIKPTHLGLELDKEIAKTNIQKIASKAEKYRNGLTIDMENSPYTDATLDIYKMCVNNYNGVGTVLQSYLFRSIEDVRNFHSQNFHIRICKGIYRESPSIAHQTREDIRDNFIRMVKTSLRGQGFTAIATHDPVLIDTLDNWISDHNISKDRFEFQVLYGVPMGDKLDILKNKGYSVRIYVPFGAAWFDYSIRRLKENPNIIWYVLANLFKR
ncbi:MAG: proline dehydrogenase family protein [Candidatus Marinimicrobia bacterium]|nr:proline dehydrogenase family protein [Candidatus Neomarinimicrobiota bacterium]MBL7060034.1 proline dehydrogenase family protein [Candidatus Neomarinimicrobiota bacterium]